MSFTAKQFAGDHCGCRYQQDYRCKLGPDGKESGTLECMKFYFDGRIRFEQHCYGEAATFVFALWADHMDEDGTLHWIFPDHKKVFYDEYFVPKALTGVDEKGYLYFDGATWPWKCADDFTQDKKNGYSKTKILLKKLFGKK